MITLGCVEASLFAGISFLAPKARLEIETGIRDIRSPAFKEVQGELGL